MSSNTQRALVVIQSTTKYSLLRTSLCVAATFSHVGLLTRSMDT